MLTVVKRVAQKRATDPQYGNVQTFLERLLVEVVSGNYRHFLHERVAFGAESERPEELCWPPLLAVERQVSGLFTSALSAVCPVSRPEDSIRRHDAKAKKGRTTLRRGRIDFAALYGSRHIGLELKRISMSALSGTSKVRATDLMGLARKWKQVNEQAASALTHMRAYKTEYHRPVTIGLLVVRISRTVTSAKTVDEVRDTAGTRMHAIVKELGSGMRPSPDFLAHYIPPPEMQAFFGNWGKPREEHQVFPGVIFVAGVHGRRANGPLKPANSKRPPRRAAAKSPAA
jgi:hypothetical protein